MPTERKTFKVRCPHCEKTFHVRYALTGSDPENPDDTGEVNVNCLYCAQTVMIEIPRKYIPEDNLLRGT